MIIGEVFAKLLRRKENTSTTSGAEVARSAAAAGSGKILNLLTSDANNSASFPNPFITCFFAATDSFPLLVSSVCIHFTCPQMVLICVVISYTLFVQIGLAALPGVGRVLFSFFGFQELC